MGLPYKSALVIPTVLAAFLSSEDTVFSFEVVLQWLLLLWGVLSGVSEVVFGSSEPLPLVLVVCNVLGALFRASVQGKDEVTFCTQQHCLSLRGENVFVSLTLLLALLSIVAARKAMDTAQSTDVRMVGLCVVLANATLAWGEVLRWV